jgi:hypothetical protein
LHFFWAGFEFCGLKIGHLAAVDGDSGGDSFREGYILGLGLTRRKLCIGTMTKGLSILFLIWMFFLAGGSRAHR